MKTKTFSKREMDIIEMRLGDGGRTLNEVGKKFNVTRERIRQIENKYLNPQIHLVNNCTKPQRVV